MSLPDLAARIAASLDRTTGHLQELLAALRSHRRDWVAARPRAVATAVDDLGRHHPALDAEAQQRDRLFDEAAALLPPVRGRPGTARHRNVSAIAAHLPAPLAARLRTAAARATAAAREIRIETALGSRLLDFSQRVHDGLVRELGLVAARTRDDVGGYDRAARRVHGTLLGRDTGAGTLIDGRM